MTEQQFIIRKGGYYYRPNAQGYTSSLFEAGRYPETEAMAHMEHCDPGEITIFPAPAVPASPTLPQDIAATAERIVLEHIAASLDIDGSSAGTRLDMLAVAIATALEIECAAAAPRHHVVGDGEASIIECLAAGKPFVFDPATNFLHADDGTVEGGIRYMPVPAHHTGRLLPCPFCGGEPEFQESNPYDQSDDVAFTVFCRECGTEHPWRSTPEDAVAFWNRRAALASAEVEG